MSQSVMKVTVWITWESVCDSWQTAMSRWNGFPFSDTDVMGGSTVSCILKNEKVRVWVCVLTLTRKPRNLESWNLAYTYRNLRVCTSGVFFYFYIPSVYRLQLKNLHTSWGVKGSLPLHKADNLTAVCDPIFSKMWEPRRLTTLWAFTACYRHSFFFTTSM
jgi:hypothetical protein